MTGRFRFIVVGDKKSPYEIYKMTKWFTIMFLKQLSKKKKEGIGKLHKKTTRGRKGFHHIHHLSLKIQS